MQPASDGSGSLTAMGEEARYWWQSCTFPWTDLTERRMQLVSWRLSHGEPAEPVPHWFAVDGPEVGGLQLVVRQDRKRPANKPAPALLDAEWYPGRIVPDCLAGILSVTTGHILSILGSPSTKSRAAVLSEMAAVFIGLIPIENRQNAVDAAADWLVRVADRSAAPENRAGATTAMNSVAVHPPQAAIDELRQYSAALTEHVAVVKQRGHSAAECRAQIVGRLAHATGVLGLLAPGDWRGEAGLLRSIEFSSAMNCT